MPWNANPRRNDAAVAKVAESIQRFGFGSPRGAEGGPNGDRRPHPPAGGGSPRPDARARALPRPEPPAHPDSVSGTLYELGPHRLLCGDSTRPKDVHKALGGARADALWTDAPYGVAYQSHMAEGGTASRFKPIENDDLNPAALQAFLTTCFRNAAAGMRPGAAFYACHANQRPGITQPSRLLSSPRASTSPACWSG